MASPEFTSGVNAICRPPSAVNHLNTMTPEVINFPFGKADSQSVTSASNATAATVANNNTILDWGTLGEATTLNLTLNADLNTGASLLVKAASDGTGRNVTFGTGITGAVLSGTANKTKTKLFVFDGTNFIATNEQID